MKIKISLIAVGILSLVLVLNHFPTKKHSQNNIAMAMAKLPISFIENQGQLDKSVRFYMKGKDHSIFFTPEEIVYGFSDSVIRQKFVGSNPSVKMRGLKKAQGKVNYLTGKDKKNWKQNISTYEEIVYENLYPGIDLVFSGTQGKMKSEFRVTAGADYKKILVAYEGLDGLSISDSGDLVIKRKSGELKELRPYIYQEIDGRKAEVKGKYIVDQNQFQFEIASHDPHQALIIDPVIIFSTYFGGDSSDSGQDIALDVAGSIYVTGTTFSADFPTTESAFQRAEAGGPGPDCFIIKLDSTASNLLYSTYLGGSGDDNCNRMDVDAYGNVYVVGDTYSTDFPTTEFAFQPADPGAGRNGFITKLDPNGLSLVYSTYLGGSDSDSTLVGIKVDGSGNAYVTGHTHSADFPTTESAFQRTNNGSSDSFIVKLDPTGRLVYSTYLGGSGVDHVYDIDVDGSGHAYVTGITKSTGFPITASAIQPTIIGGGMSNDIFITKLDPTGSTLIYSTYLGGAGSDEASSIAVDSFENICVAGHTDSTDFPVASAFQSTRAPGPSDYAERYDAFILKLNPVSSSFVYSTYLGGNLWDEVLGMDVDSVGNVYVTGGTHSTDFHLVSPVEGVGITGAFVAKLNPTGGMLYSTYFRAWRSIKADREGNAYITASGGTETDVFIAKIGEPPPSNSDLVIRSVRITGSRTASRIRLVVTIANEGGEAAAGPFWIGSRPNWYTKPGFNSTYRVLAAGETLSAGAMIEKTITQSRADSWELMVDHNNRVEESNENNNRFTFTR